MPTITFTGPRADLMAALRALPAVLAGTVPDASGIAQGVAAGMADALLGRVKEAFLAKSGGATADDGIRWAARKGPADHALLRETDRLYRSLSAESAPGRVAVVASAPHAGYHQRGTRHLPARPLWPAQLPDSWRESMTQACRQALAGSLGVYLAGRDRR